MAHLVQWNSSCGAMGIQCIHRYDVCEVKELRSKSFGNTFRYLYSAIMNDIID